MAIYLNEQKMPHAHSFLVREVILRAPESERQVTYNKGFKFLWQIYGSFSMDLSSGESYTLSPGDVLILPQNCTQYIYKKEGGFSQDSLQLIIFYLDQHRLNENLDLEKRLRNLASTPRILDCSDNVALWELYCEFRQQFDLCSPVSGEDRVSQLFTKWLEKITDLSNREPPNREAVSGLGGLIRRSFYNREENGKNVERWGSRSQRDWVLGGLDAKRWTRRVQIERSKLLLLNRNLSVESLAKESGYGSVNTFYRDFHTYQGISPKAYRDLVANKLLNEDWQVKSNGDPFRVEEQDDSKEFFADLRLCHVREYIRKNLSSPLHLEEIAWAVNLSEEHLSRMFREVHGVTVKDYIRNTRILKAKELLVDQPKLSLELVAERTGFSTTSLFCRVFKETEKCTPGMYRRKRMVSLTNPTD